MNDDVFERMTFENELSAFFNSYYDLTEFAMTTGSLRTREDYKEVEDCLTGAEKTAEHLIKSIPECVSNDYKEDVEEFLVLIIKRLQNIKERYSHLIGKSFDGEYYTFSQDRQYVKTDFSYEKRISKIGGRINRHRDETRKMIGF